MKFNEFNSRNVNNDKIINSKYVSSTLNNKNDASSKKKYIISGILGIIIGVIITGGITVAAVTLNANEIKYTPSNEKFTATNVQEAVDEIYKIAEYEIPENTYFYEKGTEGNSETIVRYKKINDEYFVCSANGIVENGIEPTDITGKTLVEYKGTRPENSSAGSAGFAEGTLYLGDGVDSKKLYDTGYNTGYNDGYNTGYANGYTNCSVIQLTSSYSKKINYPGGSITATFSLPNSKKYLGAGLRGITFNVSGGGLYGTPTISYNGSGTITFTANVAGNWADNTTLSGNVTLNVFVCNK